MQEYFRDVEAEGREAALQNILICCRESGNVDSSMANHHVACLRAIAAQLLGESLKMLHWSIFFSAEAVARWVSPDVYLPVAIFLLQLY